MKFLLEEIEIVSMNKNPLSHSKYSTLYSINCNKPYDFFFHFKFWLFIHVCVTNCDS